jgi:hypothetical protein
VDSGRVLLSSFAVNPLDGVQGGSWLNIAIGCLRLGRALRPHG